MGDTRRGGGAVGAGDQLPKRSPLYPLHGIQVPVGAGASEDDAGLRVSDQHRRSVLPGADGDPYYPIPRPENAALYRKYQELAEATPGVHFIGRLGTYKYYNMDQVVGQALAVYEKLASGTEREAAA